MKILIVSQYFWPERFRINDLAVGLKEKGHQVSVLTGKPNYPHGSFYKGYSFFLRKSEVWNDIRIYRCALVPRGKAKGVSLFLNYLSFVFFGSLRGYLIKERFEKIIVFGTSPVTACIPAIVLAKKQGIPIYFWVQDLWPESVSAVGAIKNAFILKVLNNLTKWIYSKCYLVLIQSEGFRDYILKQGVSNEKIIYFPNTTESVYTVVKPDEQSLNVIRGREFKLIFAGNLGEAQDFPNVLRAIEIAAEKITNGLKFYIIGDGRKVDYIKKEIILRKLENNVFLLGSYPMERMPFLFAAADALFLSLKNEIIFSLTIPSKLQSYLACAKPIIGAINGEGARIIQEANVGASVDINDSEAIANKIIEFSKIDCNTLLKMGSNGREYFLNNFDRQLLLEKLLGILKG